MCAVCVCVLYICGSDQFSGCLCIIDKVCSPCSVPVVNVLSIWLSACSLRVALPLSLSLSLHIMPAHVHAMDCYSIYNGERVRVVVY